MQTGFDAREQLQRLNERHKHLSLNVYDHASSKNVAEHKKAEKELKQCQQDIQQIMEKCVID